MITAKATNAAALRIKPGLCGFVKIEITPRTRAAITPRNAGSYFAEKKTPIANAIHPICTSRGSLRKYDLIRCQKLPDGGSREFVNRGDDAALDVECVGAD